MRPLARAAVCLGMLAALPAAGGDHTNLEEGLPVAITDAAPIGYLGREAQALLRYDHTAEHDESFVSELRLEAGFPRNAQVSVAVPYRFGSAEPDGFQVIHGELLYNLNQETTWLPAFSVAPAVDAPVGNDTHGWDPTVKGIATKTLPFTEHFQQLHVNYASTWNDDVRDNERSRAWRIVGGYSVRLGPQTLGIADVVYDEALERGREDTVAELGVRHQLTPLTVVSAGAGLGLTEDSPDVRATVALQYAF